ncbi:MAG TPA: hypothetical protein VNI60_00675 [Pyrinomonadaceae bacterium]|nr:hypothetical protein [Pyrinomonadaceae bacterium]
MDNLINEANAKDYTNFYSNLALLTRDYSAGSSAIILKNFALPALTRKR